MAHHRYLPSDYLNFSQNSFQCYFFLKGLAQKRIRIGYLPYCGKTSDKSHAREEGIQSVTVRKAWWQQFEATSYIQLPGRKERAGRKWARLENLKVLPQGPPPPARLHLQKIPQPSKIAPPDGAMSKHASLRGTSMSKHASLRRT